MKRKQKRIEKILKDIAIGFIDFMVLATLAFEMFAICSLLEY